MSSSAMPDERGPLHWSGCTWHSGQLGRPGLRWSHAVDTQAEEAFFGRSYECTRCMRSAVSL